jgi:hypothetical protein
MKKIMIWTRIYSGSKINLPIMIGRTRDRRAGLVPHLLTSGLITEPFGVSIMSKLIFDPE